MFRRIFLSRKIFVFIFSILCNFFFLKKLFLVIFIGLNLITWKNIIQKTEKNNNNNKFFEENIETLYYNESNDYINDESKVKI